MNATRRMSSGMAIPWLAAIVSGLLMTLSNAPYDLWYLSYIAYVPLFISTRGLRPAKQGMAYALCCAVIATNWWHSTIIFSFWFFALIVPLLCLAFFLWAWLSAPFTRDGANPFAKMFMPCLIWVGIEGILSSETVGIPCNIGISQSGQPVLIQSAALFGIYTTSFLIVLSNTTLALLLESLRAKRSGVDTRTKTGVGARIGTAWPAVLLGIVLLSANVVYGLYKLAPEQNLDKPVRIAVIQPVIESDLYLNGWRDPETRSFIKNTLDELTDAALRDKPDILVWPEGGNGYLNMRIDELRDSLYDKAVAHRTDLLISSNDLDEDGRKYNTLFSISRDGQLLGRYNKVNLIPGAEDSYTAGPGFHTLPSSFGPIGPSICYESNFPSPLREVTQMGAQILVVSTSDAAFKKTSLTINHTRTAVFRAIENHRWVVHASNTGPSVIVSPRGHIVSSSRFFERGYITGDAQFLTGMTLFTAYGYLLPEGLSVMVILIVLWRLVDWLRRLPETRVRISTAIASLQLTEARIESSMKAALKRLLTVQLPATAAGLALLSGVAVTSIVIVHAHADADSTPQAALTEFFTPLNTLKTDKVTEKFLQAKNNSCGPAVMAYILSYFGKERDEEFITRQVVMTDKGTSMLELKNAAIRNGFQASGVKENYAALLQEQLPVIAYINDNHYVVINKVSRYYAYLFDPAIGHVEVPRKYFERAWNGYLLLIRMKPIQETRSRMTGLPLTDESS